MVGLFISNKFKFDHDQKTALHYAAEYGHLPLTRILIRQQADPNIQIWVRQY